MSDTIRHLPDDGRPLFLKMAYAAALLLNRRFSATYSYLDRWITIRWHTLTVPEFQLCSELADKHRVLLPLVNFKTQAFYYMMTSSLHQVVIGNQTVWSSHHNQLITTRLPTLEIVQSCFDAVTQQRVLSQEPVWLLLCRSFQAFRSLVASLEQTVSLRKNNWLDDKYLRLILRAHKDGFLKLIVDGDDSSGDSHSLVDPTWCVRLQALYGLKSESEAARIPSQNLSEERTTSKPKPQKRDAEQPSKPENKRENDSQPTTTTTPTATSMGGWTPELIEKLRNKWLQFFGPKEEKPVSTETKIVDTGTNSATASGDSPVSAESPEPPEQVRN